jgi:nucleotide-binding universal stress UspA family protein
MKIVLAADGSRFTKKALAFIMKHESLVHERGSEVIVVNVQVRAAPGVGALVGARDLSAHYKAEAEAVLKPVERLLKRHDIAHRSLWVAGHPAAEIVKVAQKERAELIAMGTRGRGALGRVFMGSVAQEVVSSAKVPVLLVR